MAVAVAVAVAPHRQWPPKSPRRTFASSPVHSASATAVRDTDTATLFFLALCACSPMFTCSPLLLPSQPKIQYPTCREAYGLLKSKNILPLYTVYFLFTRTPTSFFNSKWQFEVDKIWKTNVIRLKDLVWFLSYASCSIERTINWIRITNEDCMCNLFMENLKRLIMEQLIFYRTDDTSQKILNFPGLQLMLH